MKFGFVSGARVEAAPGLLGSCPICASPLVTKCGEVRIWHWAHASKRSCDPWSEPEGLWHRTWKSHFPEEWQEIVHRATDGERHIADVQTPHGWTVEFQHSALAPEERRVRDSFYPKLIWVVDASRRKTDVPKLLDAWNAGVEIIPALRRVSALDCAVIRDWSDCRAPVLLDVGVDPPCWLIPSRTPGTAYVQLIQRATFVGILRDDSARSRLFEKQWAELPAQLAGLEKESAYRAQRPQKFSLDGNIAANRRRTRF